VGAAAHGLVERAEAVPVEERRQPLVDAPDDAEALVDEARVELREAGPGADFLPRVLGREDAADADDLHRPSREASQSRDHLRRAMPERRAAQAALAARGDRLARGSQAVAAGGRVGRDDAGDARAARDINNQLKLARAEAARD